MFFVSKDNLLDNNFTWQVRVRQSAVWKVSNRYTGPKKETQLHIVLAKQINLAEKQINATLCHQYQM